MNNTEIKNVIITGCNGLIGRQICKLLSDNKINIFGIDLEDKNTDLSKLSQFYSCDLTLERGVNSIVENIYKKVDNIDCLIHLAGIDYKVQEKNKKMQNIIQNITQGLVSLKSNLFHLKIKKIISVKIL